MAASTAHASNGDSTPVRQATTTVSAITPSGDLASGPDPLAGIPSPVRVWGSDRYATARAIAERAVFEGDLTYDTIGLATGKNYPDALSAGPLLADRGGPMLLADSIDTSLRSWVAAESPDSGTLAVFGGEGAVPYSSEWELLVALGAP